MKVYKSASLIILLLTIMSCNSGPTVVEADSNGNNGSGPIFKDVHAPAAESNAGEINDITKEHHHVVVKEALNTEKYTYLRVEEDGAEKWLAVSRQDVSIGGQYVYTGGLMKKNFQSKEFNRVFETVYLVSDFHTSGGDAMSGGNIPVETESLEAPKSVQRAPGAIKISDLVANISKYDGKSVIVTGKCVKVNPMIMGRNWVHIQDGSKKDLDLTVTTTDMIQLGSIVTLQGTIGLNRDFGAGYRYDYIMEGATVMR